MLRLRNQTGVGNPQKKGKLRENTNWACKVYLSLSQDALLPNIDKKAQDQEWDQEWEGQTTHMHEIIQNSNSHQACTICMWPKLFLDHQLQISGKWDYQALNQSRRCSSYSYERKKQLKWAGCSLFEKLTWERNSLSPECTFSISFPRLCLCQIPR